MKYTSLCNSNIKDANHPGSGSHWTKKILKAAREQQRVTYEEKPTTT